MRSGGHHHPAVESVREREPDWIEIVEPKSKARMFANLVTGECSWDPPLNAPVKRTQETQCWQLFDSKTSRYYYFTPSTDETSWNRPSHVDIVPLAKLQFIKESTEAGRSHFPTAAAIPRHTITEGDTSSLGGDIRSSELFMAGERDGSSSASTSSSRWNWPKAHSTRARSSGRAGAGEGQTQSNHRKANFSACLNEMLASTHQQMRGEHIASFTQVSLAPNSKGKMKSASLSQGPFLTQSVMFMERERERETPSLASASATASTSCSLEPISTSTTACGAQQNWTSGELKAPLSSTTPTNWDKKKKKEALTAFKLIQCYMGDRKSKQAPEELAMTLIAKIDGDHLNGEVYRQLMKQLTGNPRVSSNRKGWELLGICLHCHLPVDDDLRSDLLKFLEINSDPILDTEEMGASTMARHCIKRLQQKREGRVELNGGGSAGRVLTLERIRQIRYNVYFPSKFGSSLDEQMENQAALFPTLKVPWVLSTLISLILEGGGGSSEGIFRLSADPIVMAAAQAQLEVSVKPSISDPNIAATLLKQWLRQLPSSLIPAELHPQCMEAALDAGRCCQIVDSLPDINRRVVEEIVKMIRALTKEEIVKTTKMDVGNMAMVLAPNILRSSATDPQAIFAYARLEMEFVKNVLTNYLLSSPSSAAATD